MNHGMRAPAVPLLEWKFLGTSLLVHGAVLFGVPAWQLSSPLPPPLSVQLRAATPAAAAPAPAVAVERPARSATPKLQKAPLPNPPPAPVLAPAAPPAAAHPPPTFQAPTQAVAPAPAPTAAPVEARTPGVEALAAIAPPRAMPVNAAPPPGETRERRGKPSTLWLAEYTQTISGQIGRQKLYPQIARLRGWQGTTVIAIRLAADGSVLDTRIAESSGHDVLDRQALAMVRQAEPLPPFPVNAAADPQIVRLPVVFTLAASE